MDSFGTYRLWVYDIDSINAILENPANEAERTAFEAFAAELRDDLDRAEKHGALADGSPLAAIAEKLRAVVSRLGVETYGTAGEAFDPQQHEAIFHAPNPGGVADGTILDVVEVGYRLGDIELRPAKVVVAGSAE